MAGLPFSRAAADPGAADGAIPDDLAGLQGFSAIWERTARIRPAAWLEDSSAISTCTLALTSFT
jgi:hypothetical protein